MDFTEVYKFYLKHFSTQEHWTKNEGKHFDFAVWWAVQNLVRKVKVNLPLCLTKHHAMKAHRVLKKVPLHKDIWGSRGITQRILDLDTRWRLVVSFTPRPFHFQVKKHRGWTLQSVLTRWRREKILPHRCRE